MPESNGRLKFYFMVQFRAGGGRPAGIQVVGQGSWKEREVGIFLVGKSEVGEFLFKLERTKRSWKKPNEVRVQ